jgi:hypothetical protein
MIGNTVVGGFGGHCDNFNYTGMLVAVSKSPGVGVTNIQAMEALPGTFERLVPKSDGGKLIKLRCAKANNNRHHFSRWWEGWYLAVGYGNRC